MATIEVNCSVANCVYHLKGNICGAEKISIDMDENSKYDSEFAQELGFNYTEEASHSAETCCKTFKAK